MMFQAQTEWICPETFPDLSKYPYVAIDLETKDPNLKSRGSGAVIGHGEIIGFAVAVEGWSGYYPIGHREGNLDRRIVLEWIRDVCKAENTKIFHNAMYDVCWLRSYGIKINGFIVDTMLMSSLIDENRLSYSAGVDPKSEMYKLPAMYVGSYAEKDAELTLDLFKSLSVEIKKQNLSEIFDLETRLFPCIIDMRFKGL